MNEADLADREHRQSSSQSSEDATGAHRASRPPPDLAHAPEDERLRAAVLSAHMGTWDLDPLSLELACDERSRELFGITDAERIGYARFLDALHPDDRVAADAAIARALDPSGGGDLELEHRVRRGDAIRWISLRGRAFFDREGRPTRLIGVVLDVTGRRRAEQERAMLLERAEAARREAEAASRAKDEFLAMLGHELRNPLAPIVTALTLMKLREGGVHGREEEVIERQVAHLVRLVDDLLDVSRITRGMVELEKEPVHVASVVAKGVEIASPLLEQRRHALRVEVDPALRVEADSVRLAQVVANLLTNAARYTDPGGHVEVAGRADGEHALISVRDDGMGIAPDVLPRIFDMFVRGERASGQSEGGLGLGLCLVKNLVAMHEGEVVARSAGRGAGSEFVVRLRALAPDATPTRPQPRIRTLRVRGAPRRVLIVDDNEDASMLLADCLRAVGHEVAIAHDGPAALGVAATLHPELAVLDIGLPVMDGYELATRLRDLAGPGLRLFALTGYGQQTDRERSRKAGFERHFVKPVDIDALAFAIGSEPE